MEVKNISLLINNNIKLNPSILLLKNFKKYITPPTPKTYASIVSENEDMYIVSFRTHSHIDLEYNIEGENICNTLPSKMPIGNGTTQIILCNKDFNRITPFGLRLCGIDGRLCGSNKKLPNMLYVFYLYINIPETITKNIIYEIGINSNTKNFELINIFHLTIESDTMFKNGLIYINDDIIKVYDMYMKKILHFRFPPNPKKITIEMSNIMNHYIDMMNKNDLLYKSLYTKLIAERNKIKSIFNYYKELNNSIKSNIYASLYAHDRAYAEAMRQIQNEPNILIRNIKLKTLAQEHALFQQKIQQQLEKYKQKYIKLMENNPNYIKSTKLEEKYVSDYNKTIKKIVELQKLDIPNQTNLLHMYNDDNKLIPLDIRDSNLMIDKLSGSSVLSKYYDYTQYYDTQYIALVHSYIQDHYIESVYTNIIKTTKGNIYISQYYDDILKNTKRDIFCGNINPQYLPCRNNFPNMGIFMDESTRPEYYFALDVSSYIYNNVMTLKYILTLLNMEFTDIDRVKLFLMYLRHKLFEYSHIYLQVMYYNSICHFSNDDELKKISHPFILTSCSKTGVNFSCGMIYNDNKYIISYSVDDTISFIASIPEQMIPFYYNQSDYNILDMLFISEDHIYNIRDTIRNSHMIEDDEKQIMLLIYTMLRENMGHEIINNIQIQLYIKILYRKLKKTEYKDHINLEPLITSFNLPRSTIKYLI